MTINQNSPLWVFMALMAGLLGWWSCSAVVRKPGKNNSIVIDQKTGAEAVALAWSVVPIPKSHAFSKRLIVVIDYSCHFCALAESELQKRSPAIPYSVVATNYLDDPGSAESLTLAASIVAKGRFGPSHTRFYKQIFKPWTANLRHREAAKLQTDAHLKAESDKRDRFVQKLNPPQTPFFLELSSDGSGTSYRSLDKVVKAMSK